MADILIQGGEGLDQSQGLRGRLDIAVSQGKITQIAPQLARVKGHAYLLIQIVAASKIFLHGGNS